MATETQQSPMLQTEAAAESELLQKLVLAALSAGLLLKSKL